MTPIANQNRAKVLIALAMVTLVLTTFTSPVFSKPLSIASLNASGIAGVAGNLNEAKAKLARQAGITWIRSDVQFTPKFQSMYSLAKQYSINMIGILDYKTLNYNVSFTLSDWKNTVQQAQATYPMIKVWEIWNEPTLSKYQLGFMDGKPEHYFELLKSAYTILKAKDSSSIVVGLGGAQLGFYKDLPFADRVFSLGGGAYMDAISIHAYPYVLNKGQTWDYYKELWTQELQQYKQFGKPFFVTETGLRSTQPNEAEQVNYLRASYSFFKEQGASAYIWYQFQDYYETGGELVSYGLLRVDLIPKPSFTAYRDLLTSK